MFTPSPLTPFIFRRKEYLIKRDDLLDRDFSGNKARKFSYFLSRDFPSIHTLTSHGSNQSNAMYSLSVLAKIKGWRFEYYTHHIPHFLKENPQGNYLYALLNEMHIYEQPPPQIYDNKTLFISEGGAVHEAKEGIKQLAHELSSLKDYVIFLPSGTGTTALYLQKYLDIPVYTTPCVGNADYLKKQFDALEKDSHPLILTTEKKYHFGKLYPEHYLLWKELQKAGITFDLLYDPIGWRVVLEKMSHFDKIIYIHQGGLIGNETMIPRYERKLQK